MAYESYQPEVKSILQQAWDARESGDPMLAAAVLYPLFYDQMEKKEYLVAVNVLGDIATSYRVLAGQTGEQQYNQTAHRTMMHAESIAENNGVKLIPEWDFFVANCLMDINEHEKALERYQSFLDKKDWPHEKQMEVLASMGLAKFYLGQKNEGKADIQRAVNELEKPATANKYMDKNVTLIWLTGAMIKLAEVEEDKAIKQEILNKSLKIAMQHNLGAREKQIKKLLSLISTN